MIRSFPHSNTIVQTLQGVWSVEIWKTPYISASLKSIKTCPNNWGKFTITYELVRDCKTKMLMLTVTFIQNDATVALNITYHALIPKLKNNETIDVVIQIE